jgi:hypothetical protein
LNFKQIINLAIELDDLDTIKNLYTVQELINEDFSINFTNDYEDIEEVVRTLVAADLKYHILSENGIASFTLTFTPPEAVVDLVKFFAYLTSSGEDATYSSEEFNEYLDVLAEMNNLRSYYKEVVVLVKLPEEVSE